MHKMQKYFGTLKIRCIFGLLICVLVDLEAALSKSSGPAGASDGAPLSAGPIAYTNRHLMHILKDISTAYPTSVAKVRVGYTCDIPEYKRKPSGLGFTNDLALRRGNHGNIIWDYGAQHLLDPNMTELVAGFNRTTDTGPVQVLLMPTDNSLVPGRAFAGKMSKLYGSYTQCIELFNNATVLMLGLGMQFEFQGGYSVGSSRVSAVSATSAFNPSTYHISPQQANFFHRVAQSGGVVVVRGKLSEAIMLANGLPPPEVLGCPSLFINHNPTLGVTLLQKWNMVLRNGDDKDLRIAVGLPSKFHPYPSQEEDDLIRFIADNIFKVFPKSFAVLQCLTDFHYMVPRLKAFGVDLGPNRTKYFYDAELWIEDIRKNADLMFGFRIHGTMAGVAAEVPGIVVSTDHRIQELAECMGIPTVPLHDPLFDAVPFDLRRFMAAIGFNSTHFDERRRHFAGSYARIFNRMGLPLHPGIKAIAGMED